PLEEKMTLFWHMLFATAFSKLNDARLSQLQLEMLRKHSMGDFKTLLLELSTMGIGNYTDDDVKDCARAFTGWGFSHMVKNGPYGRIVMQFKFHPELHDYGEKTFLGETGNFDGEDIIDIIVRQEATAQFIAKRLYLHFVAD